MIAIRIAGDAFTAELAGFAAFLRRPEALTKALGNRLRNNLRAHFLGKDRYEPNKLKGDRTHFWKGVARSVSPKPAISADGTMATVSITDPNFAQKLFGGVIHANKGLYLTIPVSSEAHGRTAATLEHDTGIKLIFVERPFGGILIEAPKTKQGKVKVHYILKPSVMQQRDETALPDEYELQQDLRDRADRYITTARESGRNYQEPSEPLA